MARPNLGDIDDTRYKVWRDAVTATERSFKIWAARTLDAQAKAQKESASVDAVDD